MREIRPPSWRRRLNGLPIATKSGRVVATSCSAGRSQSEREHIGEDSEIFVTPAADANAAVEGRDAWHAREHVMRQQPLKHALGEGAVAAAIDGDEVGG